MRDSPLSASDESATMLCSSDSIGGRILLSIGLTLHPDSAHYYPRLTRASQCSGLKQFGSQIALDFERDAEQFKQFVQIGACLGQRRIRGGEAGETCVIDVSAADFH